MASAAALAAGHKAVRLRAAWAGASLIGVLVVATSVAASVGLHPQNRPMNAAALPSVPLLAEVHTPGNNLPAGDPCALARTFWSMNGDCHVVTVGAAEVGVVVKPSGDDRIDQWAAYRHPDGTVVYTAQSRNAVNGGSSLKPLTTLPLTVQQLAALAVDPKFHLS